MKVNNSSNHVHAIHNRSENSRNQNVNQTQIKVNNKTLGDKISEQQQIPNEIRKSDVKTTVEKLNDFMDPVRTNLKFIFHEDLNEYYVTVINPLTDEVIKEIPPKKMLDMYAAMTEFMGLLVDEKV